MLVTSRPCFFITTALTFLATVSGFMAQAQSLTSEPSSAPVVSVLGVDEFMRQVDEHPDDVTVEGVVATVSSPEQAMVLVDAGEYGGCGVVTCALLQLPVLWEGTLPQVEDHVRVSGRVEERPEGLVFVAQGVEPVISPATSEPQ